MKDKDISIKKQKRGKKTLLPLEKKGVELKEHSFTEISIQEIHENEDFNIDPETQKELAAIQRMVEADNDDDLSQFQLDVKSAQNGDANNFCVELNPLDDDELPFVEQPSFPIAMDEIQSMELSTVVYREGGGTELGNNKKYSTDKVGNFVVQPDSKKSQD
ncbi:MAG: hypothetical protein IK065_03015 [Neisseriaceae bacterium]|nr:hypothetical protein [Neisseriaceae bacterium]